MLVSTSFNFLILLLLLFSKVLEFFLLFVKLGISGGTSFSATSLTLLGSSGF